MSACDRIRRRAVTIGILDAQQHPAAVMAGEQPVEQRGTGATDMQEARGRRGEPRDDFASAMKTRSQTESDTEGHASAARFVV